MTYLIYRNKETKKIEKYQLIKKDVNDLEKLVDGFNAQSKPNQTAHIVQDKDILSLIEIAEESKKIKESDISSIEHSIDLLRNEFYELQMRVK